MNIFTDCPKISAHSPRPDELEKSLRIFLCANTHLATHFLDLSSEKIDVGVENMQNSELVMIGTKSHPLRAAGQIIKPQCTLVVRYNARILIQSMRAHANFDNENLWLAFGWSAIAMVLRLFLVIEGMIPPDKLIPASALTELKLPLIRQALGQEYVEGNWSEKKTRQEIDIDVICSHIARKVSVHYEIRQYLHLEDIVRIIRNTTAANWREQLT